MVQESEYENEYRKEIEKVYLIFFLYNSRLNKILYKQEKASMPNLMIQ